MALPFVSDSYGTGRTGFWLALYGLVAATLFLIILVLGIIACLLEGERGRRSTQVAGYLLVLVLIWLGGTIVAHDATPGAGFWLDLVLAIAFVAFSRYVGAHGSPEQESSRGRP